MTKLNNEEFILNSRQIQVIELIPESKVILSNKDFYIVKESAQEIIDKVIEYNIKIRGIDNNIHIQY